MRRAFIFGSGGHAHVIASMLPVAATFLVERAAEGFMSQDAFFADLDSHRDADVYIGIGRDDARERVFDRLVASGIIPAICVAPNAFVARDASIAAGAVILAGAVIGSRAQIGRNTIVNTLSSVDHDCRLGDHSQITAGVSIGGTVTIGTRCFFGMKSTVLPNLVVGDSAQVMAGALVTRAVPDHVLVGGSPARIVKTLSSGPE